MKINNNYQEILAIIPYNNGCKILKEKEDIIINKGVKYVLDEYCKYFGSNLEGRIAGSKYILNNSYKTPIIISELLNIILFPTVAINKYECSWINIKYIKNVKSKDNNTLLTFQNNKNIELNVSYYTIEKQILRATRLEYLINSR